MTKDELGQLFYLKKEIEHLKRQLENVEIIFTSDTVLGSSKYFPYTQHPIGISGVDYNSYEGKVNRLEKQIKRRIEELLDKTAEINEYIETIPDCEIRMILALRYVNGFTWEQIGKEMNYAGVTIKKKHATFMQSVSENIR